jgi:hypothetical protein
MTASQNIEEMGMFGFFNPEQWELSFSNINEVKEFLFRHRNLTLKRLQSKES